MEGVSQGVLGEADGECRIRVQCRRWGDAISHNQGCESGNGQKTPETSRLEQEIFADANNLRIKSFRLRILYQPPNRPAVNMLVARPAVNML